MANHLKLSMYLGMVIVSFIVFENKSFVMFLEDKLLNILFTIGTHIKTWLNSVTVNSFIPSITNGNV